MINKIQKNSDKNSTNKFPESYKKDMMMVAAVLAAAVILTLIYQYKNGNHKAESTDAILEITIDGELYGTYPLNEEQKIDVISSYGRNTVVIKENAATVTEADCPDKICAEMQKISQDGEIICCLPHRLFLTVRGAEDAGYDAASY